MADDVDRANDLYEDRRNVEIKSISRALERKNFKGECIECGEDIEQERLAVLPSAARCMTCQTTIERNVKLYRN